MHLAANTVNLRRAVSLPALNPLDEALQLAVLVPVALQVVVVDEELDALGTVLASQAYSCAHVVEVAQIVLPEEVVDIVGRSVLQGIDALAVRLTAGDGLVDHIPRHDFALAGLHHAADPLLHGPGQGVLLLLGSQRNGVHLLNLAYSDRIEVKNGISSLRLQDAVIIRTWVSRYTWEVELVSMASCYYGHGLSEILSVATPTILNGKLYAAGIFAGLKVEIEDVVTLGQRVLATRETEELRPGARGHEVDGTIDDGRLTAHGVEGERTVSISLDCYFLLYLNGRTLKFVELNLLHVERGIGCLGLQDDIVVTAYNAREFQFVNLVACHDGHRLCKILSVATPTVLYGQLYAVGIFVGSHIEANEVVAFGQRILTSGEDEEL